MSGNPFRRVQVHRPPEHSTPQDEPSQSQSKSAKKKKKVKIQTPPHSPEEVPRRLSAGRVSPPPPSRSFDDDNDSDTTATADSDLDQAILNTRRNSGSLSPLPAAGASTPGVPHNPFARTLGTSDAAFGLQRRNNTQQSGERRDEGPEGRPSISRPMDVDAFKNILMTGSAVPSPAATPSQRPQDSSSNTDASSGSRHSLSDPYYDLHQETPRTSFDEMDSPSESDNDEERSGLMTGTERLDDFAPPAPPKPGHGRPLGRKGPQTVSFADFDTSVPSASSRTDIPPITIDTAGGHMRPTMMPRSPSDLNKPLPPPPPAFASAEQAHPGPLDTGQPASQQTVPTTTTDDSSQTKQAPPPPPVSRRAGHASTSHGRSRSTSNATQDSAHEQPASPQSKPAAPHSRPAGPPPPPSRKSKPTAPETVPAAELPRDVSAPTPSSTVPPPPPRRNVSKAGNAVNRTPSNASRTSTSRQDLSAASSNQNAPPAPPPRRGKRESMEGPPSVNCRTFNDDDRRRSSAESPRLTKVSSLQQATESSTENAVVEPAGSSDILADMASFQKEIDALRARSERPG
ncbi:hypothetical protein LTR37_013780 [Vermiconidia calcicola]|uniref:Uncharacterized protein n=1 Tax=Vermiconidia calcicola TaxID=1690605 RepID=A0ACC3MVC9_9PEZI|nr:hypothetical protein LTR37_013780 [Vermiconidia calcicola]